ncbi:hypothetical protein, partial [Methylobacterium sp. P5_C11]
VNDKSDLFKLFFDFKEGISSQNIGRRTETDRQWILGKIEIAGIEREPWEIVGYGSNIVDQIKRERSSSSDFRRAIRTNDWSATFGSFFGNVVWIYLSGRVVLT